MLQLYLYDVFLSVLGHVCMYVTFDGNDYKTMKCAMSAMWLMCYILMIMLLLTKYKRFMPKSSRELILG